MWCLQYCSHSIQILYFQNFVQLFLFLADWSHAVAHEMKYAYLESKTFLSLFRHEESVPFSISSYLELTFSQGSFKLKRWKIISE